MKAIIKGADEKKLLFISLKIIVSDRTDHYYAARTEGIDDFLLIHAIYTYSDIYPFF
ncbi:hypothetical protein [Yersinia ruckeri]|uniref:hypothetical protein n=1 Tax=Yersinia ruckeri TaxID=29486 RepID=UPI000B010762|nr:hypothetical protein [Yersinia ruckeri]MCW6566729.1 hypothetical protein [Yersinia ruckeri]